MSNLYEHPWYTQLSLQDNTTTYESQSQPKQALGQPGLTPINTSRLGDIAEYVVITEALKRGAEVFKNVGCTGKTDIVFSLDNLTLHVDVKVEKLHQSGRYLSYGTCKAVVPRVLVNPETWQVRWVKGKAPKGWETFWN